MVGQQSSQSQGRAEALAPQRLRVAVSTIDPSSNRTCGFSASGSPTADRTGPSGGLTGGPALASSCGELRRTQTLARVATRGVYTASPKGAGHHAVLPVPPTVAEVPALPSTGVTPLQRYDHRVRLLGAPERISRIPGYSASLRLHPHAPRPLQCPNRTSPRAARLYAGGVEDRYPLYSASDTRLPHSPTGSSPTAPDSAGNRRQGMAHGACSRFTARCGPRFRLDPLTGSDSASRRGLRGSLSHRFRPGLAALPGCQASSPNGKSAKGVSSPWW
jgi:hypothetical protein